MNRTTPDHITTLNENEIFVFGSNEGGIHGKGAAKMAVDNWGAQYGNPEGLQGLTYAIPTKPRDLSKSLSIDEIKPYVDRFIEFAKVHPELKLLVTEIGCGLAGHKPKDIAPLFKKGIRVWNIWLPLRFWKVLQVNPMRGRMEDRFTYPLRSKKDLELYLGCTIEEHINNIFS